MGFDAMSVRPSNKGTRFFTAVPSETYTQRAERQAREAESKRQAEIQSLKNSIYLAQVKITKLELEAPTAVSASVEAGEERMPTTIARCRGCGLPLEGKPYHLGGLAYHPETGERAKINFYGGFVCSPECDHRSSLDVERMMPGHGVEQKRLGCFAQESYDRNWG